MADISTPYYARLKRYDPKRDNAMRVYVVGMRRFDADKWQPVGASLAGDLRKVHQSFYDDESPLAFEVVSAEEARARGIVPEPTPQPEANAPAAPQVRDTEGTDAPADENAVEAESSKPARGKKAKEG